MIESIIYKFVTTFDEGRGDEGGKSEIVFWQKVPKYATEHVLYVYI